MPTARQAPEFTLRAGAGLALIEDLRRLRDWYLALCRHRQIIGEDLKKQNNQWVVGDPPTEPIDDAEALFADVLQHRGSTYYYDGIGPTDDYDSYYVGDSTATMQPMSPLTSRHRSGTSPSSSLYNHPPSSPRDRPPYTLPRPRGLVLKAELLDFKTWATAAGLDTLTTAPPAAPAKPKPTGLATRDDLLKAAQSIAAAGNLAK